ncbi:3-dehydroquinate synthase II [Amycolatopsis jejuensis]|uniref:3-dehydroquinate synthase II n=1 Tax=Amycolatopsis jejuensis TaxID=330084 RepID=UPI000526DE3E|nr:3-dehydroquinate synthase II [Amycolatopsis jejuensis]
MKLAWIDVRGLAQQRNAIVEEAVHQRVDGVVAADPRDLKDLPPTVRKVLLTDGAPAPAGEDLPSPDVVIVPAGADPAAVLADYPGAELGRSVEIVDADSLELANETARTEQWSVLVFRDPTTIPLEIVLAAAATAEGRIITAAQNVAEAAVTFGVLERGSDGVMLAPGKVGDVTALMAAAQSRVGHLDLTELEITATAHVGMGERACVDTCSHFREDEGILVGSHSKGMILCVSETHPLPYMPTRPFRVNAGAIMSYTISGESDRTSYLSELRTGSKVLAVDVKGATRAVTVGRVKIETRPLISVDAVAADGRTVNLILQDDWHVRVLGPGGAVLNSTELVPGDKVLGYLPSADRHVGYAIDEFCIEK